MGIGYHTKTLAAIVSLEGCLQPGLQTYARGDSSSLDTCALCMELLFCSEDSAPAVLPVNELCPDGDQEEDGPNQATEGSCVQRHPWTLLDVFLHAEPFKQVSDNTSLLHRVLTPPARAGSAADKLDQKERPHEKRAHYIWGKSRTDCAVATV